MTRATSTVPVRVGAEPVVLGARNQRTGVFHPGNGGPSNAMTEAATDDTILVSPGVYMPFAITLRKTLTIGSLVKDAKYTLDAGGNTQNRVIELGVGVGLTLEDAELRNNKLQWGNQSGIWPTGGAYKLTLRRCVLHDLCNGILIGAHPQAAVLLEDSEFYDCGDYNGMGHNIYVGHVASFIMRRCWSHMVKVRGTPGVPDWDISWGHLVKSRAEITVLEDNRLTMEKGEANRCIDLPNGGDATIRRNKLEYRTPQNNGAGQFISYGVEENINPARLPRHRLVFEDNIAVNRAGPMANFLWVEQTEPTEYSVRNNIFAGPNMPSVKGNQKWAIPFSQNRVVPLTAFVDLDRYDWRLK